MADTETRDEVQEPDEEELKKLEEERQHALQQAKEAEVKATVKSEFRKTNLEATGAQPSPEALRKLDGSVKKNTTFVKKLKTITEQQRDSLVSDFKSLNLTKYIQEAATSIAEANKLKLSDVGCAVHLCSLLHCRYGDFSDLLLEQLQRIYSSGITKDEDKSVVTVKYRLGLRFLGELIIGGIVHQDIGLSLLHDMLGAIVSADRQNHSYLTVVLSFSRQCAEDIANVTPRRNKRLQVKHGITLPQSNLIPAERQALFRQLLCDYFTSVKRYLVHQHKEMQKRARKDRSILQSKGELSAERIEENDRAQKAYDKLLNNTSTLADILDAEMPDLPEDTLPEQSDISIDIQLPSVASEAEFDSFSLWEDEEQRSFYEDITDIRPFVPAILFEGKRVKSESESSDTPSVEEKETEPKQDEIGDSELDDEALLEQVIRDAEQMTLEDIEDENQDGEKEESAQPLEEKSTGASSVSTHDPAPSSGLLDELLGRLPTVMNRKFVDEFAVEFCLRLNTKMNRQRLVKTLFNVEKNRMDLIPFYSRLVATLTPCLPDLSTMLVDTIVRDFRHQLRKRDQTHIHTKLKNARFIAELTKFNVFPKPEAMRCITLTLQEFTHHNVDLACTCIENCGRYLLRSPDSNLRARALLEIMIRKKRVQHLDGRQKSLVENAIYAANPPVVKAIVREPLPPLLAYLHKLLYKDLTKNTIEKVLKQFRKLDWSDPKVFLWAVCSLAEIWHVKYSNIHCVADLLAGLRTYQDEAVMQVVDAILEDIRLCMEAARAQLNRRRVAMVKYLGELYNYQLIEAGVIFRTLFSFISFGCNPDGSPSAIDPYDSYFRVRLVCVLLDTCGEYFDYGSSKKKLDNFLVFFQCYVFNKRQPLPLEVEHLIVDTIGSLRPNLTLYATHSEAVEAAIELERKFRTRLGDSGTEQDGGEESDEEEGVSEHGGSVEDEEREDEQDEEEEEVDGDEGEDEDLAGSDEHFGDEIGPVLKSGPKLVNCQEDDEFQAQLDRIMNESRRTDASAKVPAVDVAIPMHLRSAGGRAQPVETVVQGGEHRIKFTLVTKKGHKQQLKDLAVPVDSSLTSGLLDTQEALKTEHREMKKLVLHYQSQQADDEPKAAIVHIKQPPPPPLIPPTQRSIQQPYHHHGHRRQRAHQAPKKHGEVKSDRQK